MFVTLCDLLPLFKKYNLENYVLALFWEGKSRYECNPVRAHHDFLEKFSTKYVKNCEELIIEVQQQIIEAKKSNPSYQTDIQLFGASLSLARLFQVQYHSGVSENEMCYIDMNLLTNESDQILSAIENINDRVLYILATSTISNMKYPFIFDEDQKYVLRSKIVFLLSELLSNLPLLVSTLLFVRCESICQAFPSKCQHLIKIIGEQLISISDDEETIENQKAVYVALRMIDDSSLTPFLIEFEKRTKNLGNLLQMNSVIFHRYFTDLTLFNNSDHALL
ncbi:hypothetical protein I4U23_004345 [Adineta vaga]|nr:hypothetical protein I4U23_004345 [Adineta vaga]